ncbi:sensor domain-containing diguanylate cyclase [Virgibacillus halodenitrificans]|uniref:sensor domain-containing diguanylate cyclase n=1 Tax=Virgibacillus halodenitrificans TaxID=1482 RepID=UPI0002FFDDD7|nr:diguanylate cyclase [Virgibacillus halodenitrificans]MCJ0931776.1 diguanylate cyclase [Virgibacillus halodenitrificans]MEC2159825.1 diguanylate cyclase [Virgibacillus halodenitrificans]CDQ37021.1 Stalked cell differentiation-controlling protein [Virgibacillus halodenitrificans]
MTEPKESIMSMKNKYFDICTHLEEYNYQQIISMLVSSLKMVLNTPFVAMYTYNKWEKNYKLINEINVQENFSPKKIIVNDQELKQMSPKTMFNAVLSIQPLKEFNILLYVGWLEKQPFSQENIDEIREETERFLTIIKSYYLQKQSREKADLLYEFSSDLLPMKDKEEILHYIIQKLSFLYPNCEFHLLLSHDLETNSDLPVKTIEYSDDVTKRASTQVFISGSLQIEIGETGENPTLYAPLSGKQGVYGVLQVITKSDLHFLDDMADFIKGVAEITGKAIENASLFAHINQSISDLKLINDTTHKLNSNLQLSEITKHIRNLIIEVCHASQIGFIYYSETKESDYEILTGSTAYFTTKQGHMLAEYLVGRNLKEAIFSGDFKEIPHFPYRSVMVTPMTNSNTIYGFIVVMHEEQAYFSFERFKLLQLLTHHSTLALTNTSLRERLERAVITDHLTKLYSRNHLEEEISNHMVVGEMGALLLFDIDDFKKVNDTFGHHVGDQVLKQVAQVIKTFIETEDIPARWGGEELAIYAPNITLNEGVQVAGLIRRQVEKFTDPVVTLSCGVAAWDLEEEDTIKDLFLRADKALYEAKNTGKNCVAKHTLTSYAIDANTNKQ